MAHVLIALGLCPDKHRALDEALGSGNCISCSGPPWQRPLRCHQYLAHLAECGLKPKTWHGQHRWPAESLPRGLGKHLVGHRVGGHHIHRAIYRLGSGRVQQEANHVIDVDPGHPLTTITELTAEAEAKRWQHARQRSTVWRHDDAGTRRCPPQTEVPGLQGFCLPGNADLGQEGRCGGRVLEQIFVSPVSVETHRRGNHQHGWPFLQGLQGAYQIPRALDTALPDRSLLGRRPAALGYRFARQMEDHILSREHFDGQRSGIRLPGKGVHAPELGACAGRISTQHAAPSSSRTSLRPTNPVAPVTSAFIEIS